eukprot:9496186-Pyramimonas_sp.AAC.1
MASGNKIKYYGKNTRAITNVQISRTKFSTDQKLAKGPSRFFLPTSSPARRNWLYEVLLLSFQQLAKGSSTSYYS